MQKPLFFASGKMWPKYPEITRLDEAMLWATILSNHINGWKTSDQEYLEDIKEAGRYIQSRLVQAPVWKDKKVTDRTSLHQSEPDHENCHVEYTGRRLGD